VKGSRLYRKSSGKMAEVINNPAAGTNAAVENSEDSVEKKAGGPFSDGCVVAPCAPHYIGKTVVWLGPKRPYGLVFPFACFVGPDWPCMLCTYALFLVPSVFFLLLVGPKLTMVALVINLISFSGLMIAYTLAACSDPGVIPKNSADIEVEVPPNHTLCVKCNACRPPRAVHCYDCDACILELDHHCPWTGKCIGKNNLQFFYAFLSFLCLHLGVLIIELLVFLSATSEE
jgi:palmitoyltransferase ZDHHC9/14/18